ncbi:hypothetical protein [Gaopeijia maritima]|uniref:hypothetical protein n=1 Tax=Gaopeijia maritima TaxID=3119007 RepID=UPI00386B422C
MRVLTVGGQPFDGVRSMVLGQAAPAPRNPDVLVPNGIDKNLVRLTLVVDAFRQQFGRWPRRVVLHAALRDDIRRLLSDQQMTVLESRLELVVGDAAFRAEDDDGHWLHYGEGTSNAGRVDPHSVGPSSTHPPADVWLGLRSEDHL